MITLVTPHLPPWKVVPKNIVQLLDAVHTVKGVSRSADVAASAVRALPCVNVVFPFGVDSAHLTVKFDGAWQYTEAIVDLGDDFDPMPWEW